MATPLPRKFDKRTKTGKRMSVEARDVEMSLSHLVDTTGGYELPHLMSHAKTGLASQDIPHMHRQFKHILGHAAGIAKANKKLSKKAALIPGVARENARLNTERGKSK